jgi:hypothetical protein
VNNLSYNLVLQDRNWVMEKLANHFSKYLIDSKISNSINSNADVNFYFNWHAMHQKTNFDVCFFTHPMNKRLWEATANSCDIGVLHGDKYSDLIPQNKRIVFHPPPFENFLPQRKIKVLIVGRRYFPSDGSDRKNFKLASLIGGLENVVLTFTEGKLTEEELKQAYLNTDYVLITSEMEAGPMCVVEALAMNKPVIAPDVGWCWDYPVIKFTDGEDLLEVFKKLSFSNNSWELKVNELSKKIEEIYTSRKNPNN